MDCLLLWTATSRLQFRSAVSLYQESLCSVSWSFFLIAYVTNVLKLLYWLPFADLTGWFWQSYKLVKYFDLRQEKENALLYLRFYPLWARLVPCSDMVCVVPSLLCTHWQSFLVFHQHDTSLCRIYTGVVNSLHYISNSWVCYCCSRLA